MKAGEGYRGPLLVTAWLSSPLAGDPPHLDALLEWSLSAFNGHAFPDDKEGHLKLTRAGPAPRQGAIRIPLEREWVGPWLVARCSSPILPVPAKETVEHVNKRLAVEMAGLLAPAERKVVTTTNAWTKSYRLPLRIRAVPCVRWFAVGTRREVRRALRDVHAIGKKPADGYGRVREWAVEQAAEDLTWFAPSLAGPVLMRPLPVGDWLPAGLLGARRDFGACCPPMWHPERATEIVVPC